MVKHTATTKTASRARVDRQSHTGSSLPFAVTVSFFRIQVAVGAAQSTAPSRMTQYSRR